MIISSLLNTELGDLNDSSLILKDDRLSMYYTIYIFLKFTCLTGKKNIFPDKNKSIFPKPKVLVVQLQKGFRDSSVKTYSNW